MNKNKTLDIPEDLNRRLHLFGFDMVFSNIQMDVDELEMYFKTLEKMISQEEEREINQINSRSKGEIDWSEEYPYWWKDIFATQLRFSFVIWAIAVLEHNLKSTCEYLSNVFDREWEDPKYEIIKSSKKFLSKVGVAKGIDKSVWGNIEGQIKIRNHLVHKGIYLLDYPDTDKSSEAKRARTLEQIIRKQNGIEIKSITLQISQEFCQDIIFTMRGLFKSLEAEIRTLQEQLNARQNNSL